MSGLKVTLENEITIIEPETYLDRNFKAQIEEFLSGISAEEEPRKILFDLTNVELVNSHGAATFYRIYEHLTGNGGKMVFCGLRYPIVEATLRDIGMFKIFGDAFFNSRSEAIRALNNGEN